MTKASFILLLLCFLKGTISGPVSDVGGSGERVDPLSNGLCPSLNHPDNGMIECSLGPDGVPTEGDTCVYICDEGFIVSGSSSRECQSDGTWTGSEPTCARLSCAPLDAPDNGMIFCTGNVFEDTCTFSCNQGYELSGSSTRMCQSDRSWSGTETMCTAVTTCPVLTDPDNGVVDCSLGPDGVPTEGDTCVYQCNEGFIVSGSSSRECQSDGTWTGSEPTCERLSCPPLTAPDNGMIDCTGNVFEDTCTFSCDNNYELSGSETRTCQSDRTWSGTEAMCTLALVICPELTAPDNGMIECSDGSDGILSEGDICVYQCDEGFGVQGSSSRQCQSDGSWSGSETTCERLSCQPLTAPDNGLIDCTGNVFEDTCTFSCDDNYELSGSETRTCQSDRTWSGTEAMCTLALVICPELTAPDNGMIECSDGSDGIPSEGDICVYQCDEGFGVQGSSSRQCQSDGSWSGSETTCERLSCQQLTAPDNGMIDCTGNVFEDTCTFSCDDNYELSGSETRTCQSDRTWSGTEAMCTLALVICPELTAPDNGMIECSDGSDGVPSEGDICLYTCDQGFSVSGSSSRECQSDGTWTGSKPTCQRLSCSFLTAPDNGMVDCTGNLFEDTCTFSCDDGYDLTGSETRTCQSDRTWSGTQAVCTQVPPLCELLDDPENGIVECSDEIPSEGDTCIYLCDDGFIIQGGATRECQSDGSWSGSEPTCARVPCIPLNAPSNGMANCSGNLFEDVCKFTCNPGYELNGSETRICMYNGEWSGTTVMCEQVTALCTPLDDPTNGMIQCSGEDGIPFEGDTCIYLCNEGYVINGGATRECLSDGTWSGSEPTCEPVMCLPLAAPDNGMIDCAGRRGRHHTFGNTCTFSCNHGYELIGSETRTCQSDGTWNGTEAMCILALATCPILTDPDNGVVDCSLEGGEVPTEGATCIYICDEGFDPSGDITRECQSDGTWSGSDITCDRVSCPPLTAPDNGMIDCTGSLFEDTCSFSCDDGYELTGSETRTCQSSRTWSGTETRCILGIFEQCPPLETSEIRVSECSLGDDGVPTPGDTCTVACKNGYKFRSSPNRTCQNDRSWSGAEIVCRECQATPLDANTRVRRRRATITFSASQSHPELEYHCRLGQQGRFRPCESPMKYNNLQAGSYTVTVRATCPGKRQKSRKSVNFTIGGRN